MLRIDLVPYTLHFRKPAATSRGALHERALWIVQAWDSARPDVRGRGEAALVPGLSRDDTPAWHAECHAFVEIFNRQQIAFSTHDGAPLQQVSQLQTPAHLHRTVQGKGVH